MIRRALAHLCAASALGSTVFLGATVLPQQPVYAQDQSFPISVACTPPLTQVCTPPFTVPIFTGTSLSVRYTVPSTHCSSIRLDILLDGKLVSSTGFLGFPGGPAGLPLDTGPINLSPVTAGQHILALQATGQVGGCNNGQLAVWGGTLTVTTGAPGFTLFALPVGTQPRGIAVNPVTRRAYVANFGSNTVTVIQLGATPSASSIVGTVPVGTGPFGVTVNPATNRVYVANQTSNNVTVIDGATNSVITAVSIPGTACGPVAAAVNPNTNKIYIADNACSGNTVSVIDGASNMVTNITLGGSFLTDVAVNASTNQVFVTANQVDALFVISNPDAILPTIRTVQLGVGANPTGVAVNDATRQIWVSTISGAIVMPDDTFLQRTFSVTAHQKIAVNRNANRAYVPAEAGSTVSVIDGALRSVTSVIVGSIPNGVAVDPGSGFIVVSNFSDNTVSIIAEDASAFAPRIVVNDTGDACCADSGKVSLRKALAFARGDAFPGIQDGRQVSGSSVGGGLKVTILFDQSVFPGSAPPTVAVTSALPSLTGGTAVVAGANAPPGTIAAGSAVVIDGTGAGITAGLQVTGSGATIDGLRIQSFNGAGIAVGGITSVFKPSVVATIPIPGTQLSPGGPTLAPFPCGVGVNEKTNRVYVSNANTANVSVIDGSSNTIIDTVTTAGRSPCVSGTDTSITGLKGVAVNSGTNRIYVSNGGTNNVTVIDGSTKPATILATVAAGVDPTGIAVNHSSNHIFVANRDNTSPSVTMIDGTNNSVIATLTAQAGAGSVGIAADPTNVNARVYVPNGSIGNISVYADGTPPSLVGSFLATGTANGGVAFNPSTNRVYLSDQKTSNLLVLDGTTLAVIANVPDPANAGSFGVAIDTALNKVWVLHPTSCTITACSTTGAVSVFDTVTNTFFGMVSVGTTPVGLAVNPVTNTVYVANQSSNTVSVIQEVVSSVVPASSTTIQNSTIINNGNAGVFIQASANNTVRNSTLTGNFAGVIVDQASATGNLVLGGSITANKTKGISLTNGGNGGIQPPVVTIVQGAGTALTVSGLSLPAATIQLYSDPGSQGQTFLGSTQADANGNWQKNSWGATDVGSLNTALSAGKLFIRATQTGALGQTSEFSTTGSFQGVITGFARCGGSVLPGATVQLFSGSAVVNNTVAGTDGSYTFAGVAPNATYAVRYRLSVGDGTTTTISCGTTVTTDANGGGVAAVPPTILNLNNHTWPSAFLLQSFTPIQDYVVRQGQSAWYKIPVQPGQRVIANLRNVPVDMTLTMYKDIQQAATATIPLTPIRVITAGTAPDDGITAPDDGITAPDDGITAPDDGITAPDDGITAPDDGITAPDDGITAPLPPDALAPDAPAGETIPAELTPAAYSSAQTRALIGVSAHRGRSAELVVRRTWDNSGFYYARVRGRNGTFDPATPFTIEMRVVDSTCPALSPPVLSLSTPGFTPHTLILTNTTSLTTRPNILDRTTQRLLSPAADSATIGPFMASLNTFASRPEVGGVVVDLANDPQIMANFTQWKSTPAALSCPTAANIVTDAIRDLISKYRTATPQPTITITPAITTAGSQAVAVGSTNGLAVGQTLSVDAGLPSQELVIIASVGAGTLTAPFTKTHLAGATAKVLPLEYIVLAGSDAAIPFRRVPDQAGIGDEGNYRPAVLDGTATQASLRTHRFLSQDVYASFYPISRLDHDMFLPDLAVGRLVESIEDISAVIGAYAATNGVVAPQTAFTSGYDFLASLAQSVAAQLGGGGLTKVDQLIEGPYLGPTNPAAWTADQLRSFLFSQPATHYDILSLQGHFSANTALAADYATRVRSDEIAQDSAPGRFANTLVISNGCHSGHNIFDPDATPLTDELDWPQVFARKGATLIGGTGYQYGSADVLGYTAQLLSSLTTELRFSYPDFPDGRVPIGKALVNAKRGYMTSLRSPKGIDEKATGVLTLYGLPMWSVSLPSGRSPRSAPSTITPASRTGDPAGLSIADVTPGVTSQAYALNRNDRFFRLATTPTTSPTIQALSYFDANGDVALAPFQPILPRQVINVAPPSGNASVARGAALVTGAYTDISNISVTFPGSTTLVPVPFRPLTNVVTTELSVTHQPYATSTFAPVRPFALNDLVGQTLVFTPMQYLSNRDATTGLFQGTGTARTYPSGGTKIRVYYSSATDATALAGPPAIYSVVLTKGGTTGQVVHVDVTVGGLSAVDVADLLVTFTGKPGTPLAGSWASCNLVSSQTASNPAACTNPTMTALPVSLSAAAFFVRRYGVDINPGNGDPTSVLLYVQAAGGNGLVAASANGGNYFSLVTETATAAAPKIATTLALQPPLPPPGTTLTTTYRAKLSVSAKLTDASGAAVANKVISFKLGSTRYQGLTDGTGTATVLIRPSVLPSTLPPLPGTMTATVLYQLTAAFGEDDKYLAAGDSRDVQVNPAPSSVCSPGTGAPAPTACGAIPGVSVLYPRSAIVATLVSQGEALREQPVIVSLAPSSGPTISQQLITDAHGNLVISTLDPPGVAPLGGLAQGAYTLTVTYLGDDWRAATTSGPISFTVLPELATVVFFDTTPQSAAAPVTLTAQIAQGTPPPVPSLLGDLTQAVVTFRLVPDTLSPTSPCGTTGVICVQATPPPGTSGFVPSLPFTATLSLPAGLYVVTTTVSGPFSAPPRTDILAVFDPTHFVTGGGFIITPSSTKLTPPAPAPTTPAPAPIDASSLKANFGFNLKYMDALGTPGGSFLFHINGVGVHVKATSFDWLVITSGTRAELEGSGTLTINNVNVTCNGACKFHAIVTHPSSGPDTFAIFLWNQNAGSFLSPDILSIPSQPLGGGSIIVH